MSLWPSVTCRLKYDNGRRPTSPNYHPCVGDMYSGAKYCVIIVFLLHLLNSLPSYLPLSIRAYLGPAPPLPELRTTACGMGRVDNAGYNGYIVCTRCPTHLQPSRSPRTHPTTACVHLPVIPVRWITYTGYRTFAYCCGRYTHHTTPCLPFRRRRTYTPHLVPHGRPTALPAPPSVYPPPGRWNGGCERWMCSSTLQLLCTTRTVFHLVAPFYHTTIHRLPYIVDARTFTPAHVTYPVTAFARITIPFFTFQFVPIHSNIRLY